MTDPLNALHATSLSASLTTTDLRASVDWYRDVVGFSVDREHEREGRLVAVSLRAGEVRLLLTQDDGARGADRARGEGLSLHLTASREAIDAVAGRIRSAGGVLDTEPTDTPWGARVVRFRDPDGFRLVVSSSSPA